MEGVIKVWVCPHQCGWRRYWHDSQKFLNRWIAHPLYGPITNGDLVARDIDHHDCEAYLQAKTRLAATRASKAEDASKESPRGSLVQ
jgi:hypothetical protein